MSVSKTLRQQLLFVVVVVCVVFLLLLFFFLFFFLFCFFLFNNIYIVKVISFECKCLVSRHFLYFACNIFPSGSLHNIKLDLQNKTISSFTPFTK